MLASGEGSGQEHSPVVHCRVRPSIAVLWAKYCQIAGLCVCGVMSSVRARQIAEVHHFITYFQFLNTRPKHGYRWAHSAVHIRH